MPMTDEEQKLVNQILASQKATEQRMAEVLDQNEKLMAKLAAAEQRTANGEQHHKAPPMTEDERWKKMFSAGGHVG